ncbi:zupT [Scenedesmus sp. PABB004]|nr:zupT [Scenedesmus sp. PABB004]
MATVSCAELWVHKALQRGDWVGVTAAVAAGAACFALIDPLLPRAEPQALLPAGAEQGGEAPHAAISMDAEVTLAAAAAAAACAAATAVKRQGFSLRQQAAGGGGGGGSAAGSPRHAASLARAGSSAVLAAEELLPLQAAGAAPAPREPSPGGGGQAAADARPPGGAASAHGGMLRLGLLMAATLTAHNVPEGVAVALSALNESNVGPIVALAIAAHNVPEGMVIALPIYIATGSRTRALALAAASGLSEPLGALAALLLARPFVTLAALDYLLAAVGGVMLAVCALELAPEARSCRRDARAAQGAALGAAVMAWTLYVGV